MYITFYRLLIYYFALMVLNFRTDDPQFDDMIICKNVTIF